MTTIFKTSLLLTVFFGLNKIAALFRQWLIISRFGLSPEIDAFNVANNLPDLIFSLFSGGALALAFIPVFVEYIEEFGKQKSWRLFSKTANFLFLITLSICGIVFVFARPLVSGELGISPGFSPEQQDLVVTLMRINLVSILIFSVSGLVMASLQSHKHFLLPALAPILYNVGMVIGMVLLAPTMGIYGLAYGTIIGSILHLLIQVPAMIHHEFKWHPVLDFKEDRFQKVLKLMIPRILTILLIQITFLSRDNLASRLPVGSVSALTYGYFIMQVPETLIGTAVATALLPSLSSFITQRKFREFMNLVNNAIKVMIAITVGITILLSLSIGPAIETMFNFNKIQSDLLVWTTLAFLSGLLAHCLLEIFVRVLYAQQNAKLPLLATAIRVVLFLLASILIFRQFGVAGIAFSDSVTVAIEVIILFSFLFSGKSLALDFGSTIVRSIVGGAVSGVVLLVLMNYIPMSGLMNIIPSLTISSVVYLFFIRKEIKTLVRI